jgi:hypothetical protein
MAAVHNPFLKVLVKKPKVEFYPNITANPKQRWRWRLWMSSDEIAASSEGYESKEGAITNFLKIEEHIRTIREKYPEQLK